MDIVEKKKTIKINSHYVDNQKLLKALMDHKEQSLIAEANFQKPPKLSNYIGSCFIKIAENLTHVSKFRSYTYKDQMVSDGIENCLKYYRNFDREITENPFSYFTQITYYAFIRRIKNEKDEQYGKYKMAMRIGMLDEEELMELGDGAVEEQYVIYKNISDFIENYEAAKKAKKEKKDQKAASSKVKGLEAFMET